LCQEPYEIYFTAQAEKDFVSKIPESIRPEVASRLDRLAQNPYKVSKKSAPPAEMPGFMVFRTGLIPEGDTNYQVKAFFHIGQDEKSVIIKFFGVVPYRRY
jgi:hypothetical protein